MKRATKTMAILLSVILVVSLAATAWAATGSTVTKDGITAGLTTDKDAYSMGDVIDAIVDVKNNSGYPASISVVITVPEGVQLGSAEATNETELPDGESWQTPGKPTDPSEPMDTSKPTDPSEPTDTSEPMDPSEPTDTSKPTDPSETTDPSGPSQTGDDSRIIPAICVMILSAAALVALGIYEKKSRAMLSLLLCLTMLGSMAAMAVPASAAGVSGRIDLECPITVDSQNAMVTAVVRYEIKTEEPDTTEPGSGEPDPAAEIGAEGEDGYYLVAEDITTPAYTTKQNTRQTPSSWDAQTPSGNITYVTTDFIKIAFLKDESAYAESILMREFNDVSGQVTWEFGLNADSTVHDAVVEMRADDKVAVSFTIQNGKLILDGAEIADVPNGAGLVGIQVSLNTDTQTFRVRVAGKSVQEEFAFRETCDKVNCMYIQTSYESIGSVGLSFVRVYKGLFVNEKFLTATEILPDDWTWNNEGALEIVKMMSSVSPDVYSLKLTDDSTEAVSQISREVEYTADAAWLEYQFLLEDSGADIVMDLTAPDGKVFTVGSCGDAFGYYDKDGGFVELYPKLMANLWYHVLVKVDANGAHIYLNHKKQADVTDIGFLKFEEMSFRTGAESTGTVLLDDILLKNFISYPEDYVEAPVASQSDDYLVGVQECDIWKEGGHTGYDWLSMYEERQSYLGFYDEMSSEASDWQIKWMAEHGIDYFLTCWYRPAGGLDAPIKQPRNSYGLEAYLNARYSDAVKFAISWENNGSKCSGSKDFRENIVPYWIEQYFKDDRYLTIDKKPVVGIYSWSQLLSTFGTVANIRAETDYLRQACIDAGFDGCIIMMTTNTTDAAGLTEFKEAGFDSVYTYNWGPAVDAQKNNTLTQKENAEGIIDVVPTVCMGKDLSDRGDGKGYMLSDAEWKELATWMKEEFMPTLSEGSLGSKMILLDNWNEYSEGHYIAPANRNGFGYLDTIRALFGDGTDHTDQVPTEKQRERINRMYVQDRKVSCFYAKDDTVNLEDLTVKTGWYFDTDGDAEGWTICKDIDALTVSGGYMSGNSTGGDPGIYSPADLGISIGDTPYIRIRIKVDPVNTAAKIRMYFITNADKKWNSAKNVNAYFTGADGEYAEYMLDMTTRAGWTGVLNQMRLDPLEETGSFAVDSIELLKVPSDNEATVVFGEEEVFTARPICLVDGMAMFPAAELGSHLNAVWEEHNATWSSSLDGKYAYIYVDGQYMLKLSSETNEAWINGETVEGLTKPLAQVIDGEFYFALDILEKAGFTVTWDSASKTAVVDSTTDPDEGGSGKPVTVPTPDAAPALEDGLEIKKGWYFTNNAEGWTNRDGTSMEWNEAGVLILNASDEEPTILSATGLNIIAEKVTQIRVRVYCGAPGNKVKMYFTNTSTENMSESKRFAAQYISVTPGADGYYTFVFDTSTPDKGTWADTIAQLRLTAASASASTYFVDSIELIGLVGTGSAVGEGGEGDSGDAGDSNIPAPDANAVPVLHEDLEVKYGWYFTEGADDWTPMSNTDMTWDPKGVLSIVPNSGTDPSILSLTGLNIAAEDITQIRLRVHTTDPTGKLKVFFTTAAGEGMNTSKRFGAAYEGLTVDADGYYTFVIDTSAGDVPANWAGTIEQLRVTPASTGSTYNIDFVELIGSKTVAEDPNLQPVPAPDEAPALAEGLKVKKGWYFTEDAEGWVPGSNSSLYWSSKGVIQVHDESANDPKAFSASGLNIVAADITQIRIRVNVVDASDATGKLKLYFTTTEDSEVDNNKRFRVAYADYTAGSDGYYTFVFDTSRVDAAGAWKGTIDMLRITPASTDGVFNIDSIELIGKVSE